MNRQYLAVVLLVFATVLCILPTPSAAVPVFARKYGFECTMCHSGFPRLNDFGMRFRQNGYQLPGRENEEQTVLQGPAPFAARTSAGWNYRHSTPDNTADVNQFQLNGLDLISAGLLGKNIGYFVLYMPHIKEMRGVAGQDGTLEMGNVVFSNIGTNWLNVRAGRMEPAYVPTSVKRRLSFSSYEIYDYAFPGGLALSDTQTGAEVYGQGRWPVSGLALGYALGYMNGGETNLADDPPSDFYGRAYVVIGPGEGQTAGQRIGFIAYSGNSRSFLLPDADRVRFTRYGFDASLNVAQLNIALQYLHGTDNKELWNVPEDGTVSGGFVELNWQPMTRIVAFGRYDWVNQPDFVNADRSAFTIGTRYYFVDQLALHCEYSRRTLNFTGSAVPDEKGNAFSLAADFAF